MLKRAVLGGLLCLWITSWSTHCEASVGDAVKNMWTYATSPVPCLLNLGTRLVGDVVDFTQCFIGNMNRNPATLHPMVTTIPTTGQ